MIFGFFVGLRLCQIQDGFRSKNRTFGQKWKIDLLFSIFFFTIDNLTSVQNLTPLNDFSVRWCSYHLKAYKCKICEHSSFFKNMFNRTLKVRNGKLDLKDNFSKKLECSQISTFLRFKMIRSSSLKNGVKPFLFADFFLQNFRFILTLSSILSKNGKTGNVLIKGNFSGSLITFIKKICFVKFSSGNLKIMKIGMKKISSHAKLSYDNNPTQIPFFENLYSQNLIISRTANLGKLLRK